MILDHREAPGRPTHERSRLSRARQPFFRRRVAGIIAMRGGRNEHTEARTTSFPVLQPGSAAVKCRKTGDQRKA